MTTIEIAKRLAELGEVEKAQQAYVLALNENEHKSPEIDFECALYILYSKGDKRISFSQFVYLYNKGLYKEEIVKLMCEYSLYPNLEALQKTYTKNCNLLKKYKLFFCGDRDFLPFDTLKIQFFKYDEKGYIPFFEESDSFGDYLNFNNEVIDRYFFKDLEKPLFHLDVYSQYQLEYLYDNVRKSEWVARDNHIYLNFTNWGDFCSYLQVLDFSEILKDKKFVFLIEDEASRYPIDFKADFGIDYSKNPVKPIAIDEIKRLIWHTQLSAHNGGDFFNEIMDSHPNLLLWHSIMFTEVCDTIDLVKRGTSKDEMNFLLERCKILDMEFTDSVKKYLRKEKGDINDKNIFVSIFMANAQSQNSVDNNSRIAPAVFFQPHFGNMNYEISYDEEKNWACISGKQIDELKESHIFDNFKYIKTFTPLRRWTTSYAAAVRYVVNSKLHLTEGPIADMITNHVINRSFMADTTEPMFKDSRIVRFEDAKLNPTATFTELAKFLDIPYTDTMKYCSDDGVKDVETMPGNAIGFDTRAVYASYDDYADDNERFVIEYLMQNAMQHYGYSNHYYDGGTISKEELDERIKRKNRCDDIRWDMCRDFIEHSNNVIVKDENGMDKVFDTKNADEETKKIIQGKMMNRMEQEYKENLVNVSKMLLSGCTFVNKFGRPLEYLKQLKPNPELLEVPLYK